MDTEIYAVRATAQEHIRLVRAALFVAFIFSLTMLGLGRPVYAEDEPVVRAVTNLPYSGFSFAISFSRDGTKAVSAVGARISLWDVKSGSLIRALKGDSNNVFSVALSSDGEHIWSGGTDGLKVWDLSSGELRSTLIKTEIRSISFSTDGTLAVTAGIDDAVRVWNVNSGKLVRSFGHGSFRSARFSFDENAIFAIERKATSSMQKGGPLAGIEVTTDKSKIRKWDIKTGRLLLTIPVDPLATVLSVSKDGLRLLSGDTSSVRLFSAESGKSIAQLSGAASSYAAFFPDGKSFVTIENDALHTWDATSGHSIGVTNLFDATNTALQIAGAFPFALSPDGAQVIAANSEARLFLSDVRTGKLVRTFGADVNTFSFAAFSANGDRIVTRGPTGFKILDTATGAVTRLSEAPDITVDRVVSIDGVKRSVEISSAGTVAARDADTGQLWRTVNGRFWDVVVEPNENTVIAVAGDGLLSVLDLNAQRVTRTFGNRSRAPVVLAYGGPHRLLSLALDDNRVRLWDIQSGQLIRTFGPFESSGARSLASSADASRFMIMSDDTITIWDTSAGKIVRSLPGRSFSSAGFSSSGDRIISGHEDGPIEVWDVASGRLLRSLKGHNGQVSSVVPSKDGRLIISTSWVDGTIRIWNADTGDLVAQLVSLASGDWVVADDASHFDASNLGQINGLNWIVSDDPLTPLSPEIFMRDYFEPRLLMRLLACRKEERASGHQDGCAFSKIRSLNLVNRAQPEVKIVAFEPEPDSPDEIAVTVKLRSVERSFGNPEQKKWQSGAYDLRLFREGKLVGQAPKIDEPEPLGALESAADLERWRKMHQLIESEGEKPVTFRHIHLPNQTQGNTVEFSAYAFNKDRVKSATFVATYDARQSLRSSRRRAYVIAVGVSAYENPAWDLKYADKDARRFVDVLVPRLRATGLYEDVIGVALLAGWTKEDHERKVTVADATKVNVKSVIDILAGRDVPEGVRNAIPNSSELEKARPGDLVLISYSSHGYADSAGNFYLFPYDIGADKGSSPAQPSPLSEMILKRAISSAELSVWLRDLDAGELVMVIDACHSAAGVESAEFKPGPMGARGLGQLAYDKGMRILASTRADDLAWESGEIHQGLLSFALVQNGLIDGKADYLPRDGIIGLVEWMKYGASRVPGLYADVKRLQGTADAPKLVIFTPSDRASRTLEIGGTTVSNTQQPAFFNYSRGTDPMFVRTQ